MLRQTSIYIANIQYISICCLSVKALHLQYILLRALLLFLMRMMKTYFHRTKEKCGHKTSKCKKKKLDKFFFPWVECTGFPQYGSSCLF